jgi:hypothetical protein
MKKIAFIKDGIVGLVLNTDESLSDSFLNSDARLDVTDNADVSEGWSYSDGVFTAPAN